MFIWAAGCRRSGSSPLHFDLMRILIPTHDPKLRVAGLRMARGFASRLARGIVPCPPFDSENSAGRRVDPQSPGIPHAKSDRPLPLHAVTTFEESGWPRARGEFQEAMSAFWTMRSLLTPGLIFRRNGLLAESVAAFRRIQRSPARNSRVPRRRAGDQPPKPQGSRRIGAIGGELEQRLAE